MKNEKIISISILFLALSATSFGQTLLRPSSETITLEFEQESGNNAAAVAYNPSENIYYASFGGNENYPLETFSSTGANLNKALTDIDLRGLWWNTKAKQLEGNGFSGEIVKFKADQNSYPGMGIETIFDKLPNQFANSCGVMDNKGKEIFYYYDGKVVGFVRKSAEYSNTNVRLKIPGNMGDINVTNMIYTGQKKMEFGVLNFVEKEVYLFDKKTGEHTGTIKLPRNAVTQNTFRFSYANGYIFLYNTDTRSWKGYKTF